MNSHCEEGDRARRGNLNLNRCGLRNDTVIVALIKSAFTQGERGNCLSFLKSYSVKSEYNRVKTTAGYRFGILPLLC